MKRIWVWVVVLACAAAATESGAVTAEKTTQKAKSDTCELFIFSDGGNTYHFPYSSSMPIDAKNESITRLLIAIHGLGYNPTDYLNSGIDSAALVPEAQNTTLVVAPHFLNTDTIPEGIGEYFLYWNSYPFWGTQNARRGPAQEQVSISAYAVLDFLLTYIVNGNAFPNLERIVIAGHSAGGQFVNRYAASNRYDVLGVKPFNIKTRYVIMAPGSYLYFDENRAVPGTVDQFTIPISPPAGYNDYGLGMNALWAYLAATGPNTIRNQYFYRNVYYLVGSEDTGIEPGDSEALLLQGPERLTRSEIYYNYIGFYYGASIYNNHKRAVVSGVGHWGRGLMLSQEGLNFIHGDEEDAPEGEGEETEGEGEQPEGEGEQPEGEGEQPEGEEEYPEGEGEQPEGEEEQPEGEQNQAEGEDGRPVTVPNVIGMSLENATNVLDACGLRVGDVSEDYHASIDFGQIMSQIPAAGSSLMSDSTVDLIVSKGPHPQAANEGEDETNDEGEALADNNDGTGCGSSGCRAGKPLIGNWLLMGATLFAMIFWPQKSR